VFPFCVVIVFGSLSISFPLDVEGVDDGVLLLGVVVGVLLLVGVSPPIIF